MSDFDVMIQNVVDKWERTTGRQMAFLAPELSATKSLIVALQILEQRISKLENERDEFCCDNQSACPEHIAV